LIRALFSAASGMVAQQMNIDNVANNLANASTTGFKHRRMQFEDLMYQNLTAPGTAAGQQTTFPSGLQLGLGTRVVSNEVIFSQGDFISTENPLDLVIEGSGFFQVRLPTGELAYTRAGAFHLDRDGNIVTADGDSIEPAINIDAEAPFIQIASDGTVSYQLPGTETATQKGPITLALFQNPAGLRAIGKNLFQITEASGAAVIGEPGGTQGHGALQQGFLENSNVSVVEEFINMIVGQRTYEANARVVRAADEMYQEANSLSR
jgi:flagellar basal-body rod protein FlgG